MVRGPRCPCAAATNATKLALKTLVDTNALHLGLDVSTRATGISVLSLRKSSNHSSDTVPVLKIESADVVELSKVTTVTEKAVEIRNVVKRLRKEFDPHASRPWHISVEAPLANHKVNVQGLARLIELNGVVNFMLYDVFGKAPNRVYSQSARRTAGFKNARKTKFSIEDDAIVTPDIKTRILAHVEEVFGPNTVKWKSVKRELEMNGDIADSIIVATDAVWTNCRQVLEEQGELDTIFADCHSEHLGQQAALKSGRNPTQRTILKHVAELQEKKLGIWSRDFMDSIIESTKYEWKSNED